MDMILFCGGEEYFNYNRDFNTTNLHFSYCFEHTVFDLVPCVFLVLFGIPYYFIKRNSHNSPIGISRLFIAKLVFAGILWLLTWFNLGYAIWESGNNQTVPYVDFISPCVLGLGMAKAAFYVHFDRLHGVRTSSLLTCYWTLYLILWALIFKSQVELLLATEPLSNREVWRCVTFFISYACVIAEFIMCFFVDNVPTLPPNDPFEEEKETTNEEAEFRSVTRKLEPSPELSATFLSKISFEWFTRMTLIGYKRPVVDADLWDLNRENKAGRVSRHFISVWNAEKCRCRRIDQANENVGCPETSHDDDERVLIEQPSTKKKRNPYLLKVMIKTFGPYFLLSTFLKIINDLMQFVSPQILSALIAFVSNDAPVWQGYIFAVLLFVSAIFQSIILQNYFHICYVTGLRVRSAVVALVYRKSLEMTNSARKESTTGEVVNLMSVDAQRFMDLLPYVNNIWSSPFQIILAVYFLWQILGPSTLAGLGVMVLLIPVNAYVANKAYQLQTTQMELKDKRIKLMNEILNGIKVLKMYAWEMSFKDKIGGIRNSELKVLRNFAFLNASVTFTWTCAPFLVSLVTFAVYVLSDSRNVLDAQKAFVSLSLFNILQFPLIMLPIVISSIVQANVSLKRLQKFVNNEELDPDNVDRSNGPGPAISVENGTFKWSDDEEPVLRDISMTVERGTLVAIVGQVGSGKSSLLSSLLGDMQKVNGQVSVKGSVAYVAQQAWIQNLTVRDNILFGKPMNVCKYQDTVEACELKEDFEMLPAGGLTEIGERGINLSGGQKQRVSIARAVYQDAEVYLFDDPLSAVDAHVGKHIFDNVLGPDGCLQSKTRVLVTHGVGFLPQVDQIYVVVNGKISEVGTYNELLAKKGDFSEFLKTYANKEEEDTETEEEEIEESYGTPPLLDDVIEEELNEPIEGGSEGSAQVAARRIFQRQTSRRSISDKKIYGPVCQYRPRKKVDKDRVCKLPDTKKNVENKLMTEETAETGNVNSTVVVSYMKSIGFFLCVVTILGYTLDNASSVYSSIWLSQWTADPVINGTQSTTNYRLAIYGVLGLSKAFFVLVTAFSFSIGAVYASTHLHAKILNNIMKAPMSFFDTTPLGRIVNRFSKDIYLIDEVIPQSIMSFLETFFQTLSTLFVIIYSTPIFGAVIVPILLLYYFVQRFYVRTSRQLKRLESISRSPIYSHFSESLAGVSTIRAYRHQKSFIKQNEQKVDKNQMAYYPNVVSNRWLALRLEIVGNLIVFFAALFAVLESRSENPIEPGVVGLSVSYAMQITMILNWMVRSASEAETNIVAVERVEEYSKVKQEAPLIIDRHTPPPGWPEFGGIKFQHYSTRYRDELDLVVKDIDVNIQGGEKIGIVGRTGAGKSSLTLALFRVIEAAEGRIVIDGLDVGSIGLHSLRSKLSIIPQDPVLFSGTLRMNLDPFETYTDDELWNALEHSHLKNFASSLPKKLDHEVSEGGENLSVGQRQLVCLARALLRQSKILVLDEATAAVDLETDDLIQATIREKFSECTTFTIAHRLNTIMDSTRVLVLDAGKVAEYDSPEKLLKNKGIFYEMAKDAGLAS